MGTLRTFLGDRLTDQLKRITGVEQAQLRDKVRRRTERDLASRRARIAFLKEHLPQGGVGAELGVFKGEFSPLLLEELAPTRLHLIDPWYLHAPFWEWAEGRPSTVDALLEILRRHRDHIHEGRVLIQVADDRQALAGFASEYFDWVYIDSSHQYQHTWEELSLLKSRVKSTGVIAGDDWYPEPEHMHHGVYRAVQEFMQCEGYRLVDANTENRQWVIARV